MRRIAPARTASPITLGDRLQLLFHQELAEESGRITCYQWVMSFPGEPQEPSFLHLREKMSIHVKKWPVFVVFASGSYGGRPAEGSELHNPKVERRRSAGLSAKPQTQVPSFLRASGQKGGQPQDPLHCQRHPQEPLTGLNQRACSRILPAAVSIRGQDCSYNA